MTKRIYDAKSDAIVDPSGRASYLSITSGNKIYHIGSIYRFFFFVDYDRDHSNVENFSVPDNLQLTPDTELEILRNWESNGQIKKPDFSDHFIKFYEELCQNPQERMDCQWKETRGRGAWYIITHKIAGEFESTIAVKLARAINHEILDIEYYVLEFEKL